MKVQGELLNADISAGESVCDSMMSSASGFQ